jgi:ubiquitin C
MRNQHSFVSKTKDIFNRSLYSLIAAMVVLPLAFAALVWIFIFVAVVLFAIARVQDEAWSSTQKNLSQNPGPPEDSTPSFILSILEYILKASEDTTNYSFELEVRISDTSVTTTTYVEVSSCDTAEELKAKICLKGSLSSLGPLCLFFCGRELQDGHSLLDQSVVPGSVVFLVNQRLIVKCDQSQKVLILDFGSEDSVHDIKAKIWVKTGPFPVEQSLFLAGEQLKDSYGLCNYNIRFGSILHLVLDQRPRDTREVLICAPNGKTIVLNPPIWTSIRDLKDALGHIVGLEPFFQTLTLRGTSTRLPPDLTLRDIEEGIRARWRPDYTFQFLVVHNGRHYQSAVAPKSGRESEWGLEKPEAASTGFVSLDKIHPPSEYEQELVNCRAYGSRAPYPKEIESTAEPQLPVYSAAERVIHLQSSLGKIPRAKASIVHTPR